MESDDNFLRWEKNHAELCVRIEKVKSLIKIVLVTKNDPFFIERWIEHHMKIVGPQNLIIFDNMSEDPAVISVYRKYRNQINIVQFADRYYKLHHTRLYGELYRSLARSSEYSIFLDTDEYLILMNGDQYYDDDRILDFVRENLNYDFFPSTWLMNSNWSSSQFSCGTKACGLANNLACGKPLIRAKKIPAGYVNHNFQFSTALFVPPFKTDLFLLHLTRLFPQQRILTNLNKLVTEGVAQPGESPESVAGRSDIADGILALYVREIRECLALRGRQDLGNVALGPGCLELLPGGNVTYYGDAERKTINEFINDPNPAYDLIPDHYRLTAVSGA